MSSECRVPIPAKFFGGLQNLIGSSRVTLHLESGAVVEDVLVELREHYPALYRELELGISKGYLNILLNGQNIRFLDEVKTELSDGSTLAFLRPIGGG